MGSSAAKGTSVERFLQGRRLQRDLCVLPVPELAAALNVAFGEVMKLNYAAHGLVDALVEWYISILTVLEEHVCHRLKADPCCSIVLIPIWSGVRVEHQEDGGFLLSRSEFVDELREIQIPSRRRKENWSPVISGADRTERIAWWTLSEVRTDKTSPQHSAGIGYG